MALPESMTLPEYFATTIFSVKLIHDFYLIFQSSSNNGRGSMRKVLPALPDMDTQMSLSAKMIDRRTSTPKGNHRYEITTDFILENF